MFKIKPEIEKMPTKTMKINSLEPLKTIPEPEVFESLLTLDNTHILELGCGDATLTRIIASNGSNRKVTALEVDTIQHAKNCAIDDLSQVNFELAGSEEIPAADNTFDIVFMFKSLHHVPIDKMPEALDEINRVLKPDGLAYISEPVFAGDFNEVLRLFHNEEVVRQAAFDALKNSIENELFELVDEVFFNTPVQFDDFSLFEQKVIGATHSEHALSTDLLNTVKEKFAQITRINKGQFLIPIRADILKKKITN